MLSWWACLTLLFALALSFSATTFQFGFCALQAELQSPVPAQTSSSNLLFWLSCVSERKE